MNQALVPAAGFLSHPACNAAGRCYCHPWSWLSAHCHSPADLYLNYGLSNSSSMFIFLSSCSWSCPQEIDFYLTVSHLWKKKVLCTNFFIFFHWWPHFLWSAFVCPIFFSMIIRLSTNDNRLTPSPGGFAGGGDLHCVNILTERTGFGTLDFFIPKFDYLWSK